MNFPHLDVWYVSDKGSDVNNCQRKTTPCKNLQTVLNRATDGADIYVTSETLSLDGFQNESWLPGYSMPFYHEPKGFKNNCQLMSSISYTLTGIKKSFANVNCSSEYMM